MPDDLAQALSAANVRASALMAEKKRLATWFLRYPDHPWRERTMWEIAQDEQRALDEYVRLRGQWTARQALLEAQEVS